MNTKPSEASPHDQSTLASQVNPPDSSVDDSAQVEAAPRPQPSATSVEAVRDASRTVAPGVASRTLRTPPRRRSP